MIKKRLNHKEQSPYMNDLDDHWLKNLPLAHPEENFSERVMAELVADGVSSTGLKESPSKDPIFRLRREFLHGLTAAFSTYLFIQSGIMGKIMTLDVTINHFLHFIASITR